MDTHTISHCETKSLYEHELLKRLPPLSPEDPTVIKIARSIQDIGRIIDPLKITDAGALVDGRRRMAAARRLKLETVPCMIVADEEIALVILAQAEARAHFTKSQRAYMLAPLIDDGWEAAQQRQLSGLKQSPSVSQRPTVGKSLPEWSAEYGLGMTLLKQIKTLMKYFDDPTERTLIDQDGVTEDGVTFMEFYHPRIMREDKPYSLGGVLAGIGGHVKIKALGGHGGGVPKAVDKRMALFGRVFSDELIRIEYWEGANELQRLTHWHSVSKALNELKADKLRTLAEYHAKLAALCRKTEKAQV